MTTSTGFIDIRTTGDLLCKIWLMVSRDPWSRSSLRDASRCLVAVVLEASWVIERLFLGGGSEPVIAVISINDRSTDDETSLLDIDVHAVTVLQSQIDRMSSKPTYSVASNRRMTSVKCISTSFLRWFAPRHGNTVSRTTHAVSASCRLYPLVFCVTKRRWSSTLSRPRNTSQKRASFSVRLHTGVVLFSFVGLVSRAFALQTSTETNWYLVLWHSDTFYNINFI